MIANKRAATAVERALRSAWAAGAWLALLPALATAQQPTEWGTEPRENTPRWHALTGVTLVAAPGRVLPDATVVLRDGRIVAAGAGVAVPAGARVWALPGRRVYAGFIELSSSVGVPASLRAAAPERPRFGPGADLPPPTGPRPEMRPLVARGLAARNGVQRAEQDVAAQLEWREDDARALRELGFTVALATPAAGVWRGQGALLALGAADAAQARAQVITPRASQHLALQVPPRGDGGYPNSVMGAVALARQSLYDARWYRSATAAGAKERVEPNDSLAALAAVLDGRQPLVVRADNEQDYGRIARLRDEFGLKQVLVHGHGGEYRRAAQLKAMQLPVLVPLSFPPPPDVQDPDSALDVPLSTLQHWEQAPSNPMLLHRAGVPLALTSAGLRDAAREFWPRVRQAVQRGWPADAALAALTTQPAALLGEQARLGTVEPGRMAHLVVMRGDPFVDEDAAVEMLFVDGRPVRGERAEALERGDPRGDWAGSDGTRVRIGGPRTAPRVEGATPAERCPLQAQGREWVLRVPCAADAVIVAQLQGDDRLAGTRQAGSAPWQAWSATRLAPPAAAAAAASAPPVPAPPAATYPAGIYGIAQPVQPPVLLVRNATVWTQGPAGVQETTDVLVRAGRITAVGRGLAVPAGAEVIDASGRHLTPGLIDAHSHIAASGGVNEGTNSVTAEVRISDVLDPTDITIYRQLAGGLTAANILHGSANTIGGQSQVIKLRWGGDGADLVFAGARPSIKFALGENPRGVNFASGRNRYPATRMGVEQVLRDAFAAGREYAADWKAWRAAPRSRPEPRRDLRLETIAELIERKRVIHIHSYRADEILMFTDFAREWGLEVAAFQHVLEGYKVAGAIASIGAGASSFSDWWGFKMEVIDAVPHNGALMQRAGVLVSFNSDDAETGRRMNTEAAKALRFGGLSEPQALALVTINAARQLGVADRVGSIEVGKDADFVLWNGPPLATTSRAEQTWIDGRRYYDIDGDRRLRDEAARERQRLVAAALKAPRPPAAGGGADGPPGRPRPPGGLAADIGRLAWLDAARALRGHYSVHDAWHECTEDGAFVGLAEGFDFTGAAQ
jgi:imidazolonepropionase-like amidohydrolase